MLGAGARYHDHDVWHLRGDLGEDLEEAVNAFTPYQPAQEENDLVVRFEAEAPSHAAVVRRRRKALEIDVGAQHRVSGRVVEQGSNAPGRELAHRQKEISGLEGTHESPSQPGRRARNQHLSSVDDDPVVKPMLAQGWPAQGQGPRASEQDPIRSLSCCSFDDRTHHPGDGNGHPPRIPQNGGRDSLGNGSSISSRRREDGNPGAQPETEALEVRLDAPRARRERRRHQQSIGH